MRRLRIADLEDRPERRPRACDRPGCGECGEYRAPRSRADLNNYFWFCLAHVREYNASWNYYAGMSDIEIEAEIRSDTTWQRPTWPLGARFSTLHGRTLRDDFGLFGGDDPMQAAPAKKRPLSPEEQALQVFAIEPPFTLVRLKARYKELVKLHHPDAHGGDKEAEEKLKVINLAYSTLKASYFS